MTVLGAIIAGGQSKRFGADKAAARVDGRALIEHTHEAVSQQVDAVVICGRDWAGWKRVDDAPAAGLGPLGGLAGALHYAQGYGFQSVLSLPVDTYPLPSDLIARLQPAPAAFAQQYLIGLWPTALGPKLIAHLDAGHRSVRSWIEACDARLVDESDLKLRNINSPHDVEKASD